MVEGTENLPESGSRPLLFVGNHTLYGLYDLPFIMMELYLRGFKVTARHENLAVLLLRF